MFFAPVLALGPPDPPGPPQGRFLMLLGRPGGAPGLPGSGLGLPGGAPGAPWGRPGLPGDSPGAPRGRPRPLFGDSGVSPLSSGLFLESLETQIPLFTPISLRFHLDS